MRPTPHKTTPWVPFPESHWHFRLFDGNLQAAPSNQDGSPSLYEAVDCAWDWSSEPEVQAEVDRALAFLNALPVASPYDYVRCPACNLPWQMIDYRCALHQVTCPNPPDPIAFTPKVRQCGECDLRPALVRLTLTNLDGEVLDTLELCKECAPDAQIASTCAMLRLRGL